MIGGMVNVVGFLGVTHEAITHLTGTVTLSAIALSSANWATLFHLLAVLLAYFAGSVTSGFIIQQSTLQLGYRYGVTLLLEALLLLLAAVMLQRGMKFGEYLATGACGLQNAMVTSYSGAVIRTTHLSGIITDLGIWVGHFLRGLKPDSRKAWLSLVLILGFFLGAFFGTFLFATFSYAALFTPAVLTGGCGLFYSLYKAYRLKP